eukprot:1809087-Pleurochrysis_carterae.AAC.5
MERVHDLQPTQRLRQLFGQSLIWAPHRLVGCEKVFLGQSVIVDRIVASIDDPPHGKQSSLHCIPVSLLIVPGLWCRRLEQFWSEQGAHEQSAV